MSMTKNAIGNLINKYRAALAKCRLLNTLGSLAVAGALVLGAGGAGVAADSGLNVSSSDNGHHWGPRNPADAYQAGVGLAAGVASGGNVHIDTGNGNYQIYGGFARSGNANNNRVTMTGGQANSIYGGYSYSGNANNNTVTISGGHITGSVYGSRPYLNLIAENNTVIYSGGRIDDTLQGGASTTPANTRNNTLVTIGKREIGGFVKYFQNYHFVLDADQNVGLTAGGSFDMDLYTNKILGVDILGGGSLPREGDTLTVVQTRTGITPGPITGTTGVGKKGATLLFDYTVINPSLGDTTMTAKVSNVRVNPQAKALSEGAAANAALVNMGADAVAGAGMASALAASANNAPAGTTTIAPFGTMQAGSSRIETGSHVNVSSLNFIAGIALGQQTEFGKLLVGPFFEAGFGSYNTYNSFDNAASVNGNGRTNFLGAGILARFDFADMALGHPWLEGSFRIGHAFNSYNNDDLRDGAGNTVDYDTDAPYQSFHVGLGYMFNFTETDHLDVYGKYFWSHLGGSDAKPVGDPIDFDDVYSSRLRFGGRYSHDFGTDRGYAISPYIGAAWEHEFDGKARATTYGRDIKAPTLKGDTGIGELGVAFKHQNGLSLDLGLNGYVGKRQGVMGNLMLKYEF